MMQNDLRNSYDLSSLLWIVAVLLAVLFSAPAIAGGNSVDSPQQSAIPDKITIKGTVVDKNSLPVAGATVVAKDRPALGGTVTDHKGHFTFAAPLGTILQISFVGYAPEEKAIDAQTEWIITLQEDNNVIDDIVVVGYGVQKKESVIGAISQVKGDELVDSGTTNLKNALAGKVSGMSVISSSGAPGEIDSQTSILLRGLSSWKGNSPLVMVDGIERDMASLSPNEVASISVLKDASATAVYGSKGANGVILITTKTGVKGKPKFKVNVEYSANTPMFPVEHVDAPTIINMANIAYRNAGSFGSLYSDDIIKQYADQSNPLRYPDVNWYELMTKDFSSSVNADFSMVGGSNKVRYYIGVGYVHDGSILKEVTKGTNYQYDKFNYRVNLDWDITKSTSLSFKFGGATQISRRLNSTETSSTLFSTMYQAPSVSYPAYYPAWALGYYPDPDYPTAEEIRIADNQGCVYENPYSYLMDADYRSTMTNRLMTDVILKQDLNFITKGLSFSAKVGLTSNYSRIAKQADQQQLRWDIVWDAVDLGNPQVWRWEGNSNYVYNEKPYAVTQNNSPSGIEFISYYEASLNYARKFSKKHNVTALALYNQRQVNSGSSFPKRNQSFVGRLTYDYKGKYLFEANLGVTGSEQFAPSNRYGVFPSGAVGYYISKEPFWQKAMPWWSTMKIRYSNGWVGSDASSAQWLYYSAWKKDGNYIKEDGIANLEAKWETAHKQDLGIEMGWLQNTLTLNVDFFDETREDIFLPPIVTMFVGGVGYKEVNMGAVKKHGMEIELNYSNSTRNGFHYNAGVMFGLNENRITRFNDAPYIPAYQKTVNTQYGAPRTGNTLIDDKYFNSIDELHGYPLYSKEWTNITPGIYKFLDYKPDGIIDITDLHTLDGSTYAPVTYSFNLGFSYKGLTFKTLWTGTIGKYINYRRASIIPFYAGDLVVHAAHLNYWRPDNHNSDIPALSFNDQMYAWSGGTSKYPGYDLALPGYTWRKSDYLTIKEVMLAYKFSGSKIKRALGVESLGVTLSCNNLWTFFNSSLKDTDPQRLTTASNYYPTMRILKLSVNLAF